MRRVLLVEDNADDVALTEHLLSHPDAGWHCEVRGSVRAARERLRQGGIDVVLMDLGLPDSAGTSAVREMAATAPGVPVVVMTGHMDEKRVRDALEAGARGCVVKGDLDAASLNRLLLEALQG